MKIKLWHIVPYCPNKRLGHIHNEFVKLIPNEDWVMLTDPDVLFLHPLQHTWITEILEKHGNEWDLLGCMTNRIGNVDQRIDKLFDHSVDALFNDTNIMSHQNWASLLSQYSGNDIEETNLIAGFCMIFKKSLWNKIKFREGINFDIKFCEDVKKIGGKIGIMKGIYVYHNYRLGSADPQNDIKHLLK